MFLRCLVIEVCNRIVKLDKKRFHRIPLEVLRQLMQKFHFQSISSSLQIPLKFSLSWKPASETCVFVFNFPYVLIIFNRIRSPVSR